MSRAVLDLVAARLEALIPSRTVFVEAVPDGTLPARYLLVQEGGDSEEASSMADKVDLVGHSVLVKSVSFNTDPVAAAREAGWGEEKARDALRGWRPVIGTAAWKARASNNYLAPTRDDSTGSTAYMVGRYFDLAHQL